VYEKYHSAYEPVIVCNRKQGHYSGSKICKMMTLNEIHYSHYKSMVCVWELFKVKPTTDHKVDVAGL
jgi:hypothetical protein